MNADNVLVQFFSYYDKMVSGLSPSAQALIALVLLFFLVWQIYMFIKSGHWMFLAILIICLPGTWPALRQILNYVWKVLQFLLNKGGLSV
jgi:uncharacterized membrane protein YccC